jgi:hypothetical protein
MKTAIEQLQICLDVLTTNEPIHRAAGNIEQADYEASSIIEISDAITVLKSVNDLESPPAILGAIYQPTEEASWPNMRLVSFDRLAGVKLKDPESPWTFECNFATFRYYWKLAQ